MTEENAVTYAAMRSFAAAALQRGESEGLYRAVDDLLLRRTLGHPPHWILDAGCGTGRTLVDAAAAFPDALAVGLDSDQQVLRVGHAIAHFRGSAITADLTRWGLGVCTIAGRGLSNTVLVQAESEALPFASRGAWAGFDAVTCVNLLDRTRDPAKTLSELVRVLAPGGLLVVATPLDWRRSDSPGWPMPRTLSALCGQLVSAGLSVDEAFDGLLYREIIDSRGSALDWQIAVVCSHRDGSGQTEPASQSTLL